MVNTKSTTTIRPNAHHTRSEGTPMRLNHHHPNTSGRKQTKERRCRWESRWEGEKQKKKAVEKAVVRRMEFSGDESFKQPLGHISISEDSSSLLIIDVLQ